MWMTVSVFVDGSHQTSDRKCIAASPVRFREPCRDYPLCFGVVVDAGAAAPSFTEVAMDVFLSTSMTTRSPTFTSRSYVIQTR